MRINFSDRLLFIEEDPARIKDAILESIGEVMEVMLQEFGVSGTSMPSPNLIQNKGPFLQLNFNKHFAAYKDYPDQFNKQWIEDVFDFTVRMKEAPNNPKTAASDVAKEYLYLTPNYPNTKHKLGVGAAKLFLNPFKMLLYALNKRKVILLPAKSARPETRHNQSNGRREIGHKCFSPALRLVRQPFIDGELDVPNLRPYIGQTQLRNFDWKAYSLMQASEFFELSDFTTDNIIAAKSLLDEFQSDSDNEGHILYNPVYRYSVLVKALIAYEGDEFSIDDTALMETFSRKTKLAEEMAHTKLPTIQEILDGIGVDSQLAREFAKYSHLYLKQKLDRKEVIKTEKRDLKHLQEYLFVDLPADVEVELMPKRLADFTRKYIEGIEVPSIKERFENTGKTVGVSVMRGLDLFFKYLEIKATEEPELHGFKNCLIRQLDFPISERSKGTNKRIFTDTYFPLFHAFLYAMVEFACYLIDQGLDKGEVAGAGGEDTHNTQEVGFVPVLFIDGKCVPLFEIPTRLFGTYSTTVINGRVVDIPNIHTLVQFCVAIETGLRHIHVRWLDADTYDSKVDRKNNSELQPLIVNTDKAKEEPWVPLVSHRVIKQLDRLKRFMETVDVEVKPAWYNRVAKSRFGKIRSLFCPARYDKFYDHDGTRVYFDDFGPATYNTYKKHFDGLIFFFDLILASKTKLETLNVLPKGCNELPLAEAFKLRYNYKNEITPHGTRATVVSDKIRYLPESVIMENYTGHDSKAALTHYVVPQQNWLKLAENNQKKNLLGYTNRFSVLGGVGGESDYGYNSGYDPVAIKAELVNSTLKKAMQTNPQQALTDFGAVSMVAGVRDDRNNTLVSGISTINSGQVDNICINSTHICPFNNQCPKDILVEIGGYNCGQCWYSIKTVDHLPRIASKIRMIGLLVKEQEQTILDAKARGASPQQLSEMERSRKQDARELSAWIVTHGILLHNLKDISNKTRFFVGKPEILMLKAKEIEFKNTEINKLILGMVDAENFQECFTPQLKAQLTRVTNRLLARTGMVDKIIELAESQDLLSDCRGIFTSICDLTGLSLEQIVAELEKPIAEQTSLLEFTLNAKKIITNA
ncbi:hypothetical protein FCL40_17785 [Ferrimonas sediminicola]|uniref:Uncharacterized protein n=1 Tax=Ferrimonas sediminicola TaxID=2569538 RepID=A0A4U1B8Z3_9GAMM|nr:hypothetical protein [Ferrimonas sediminicola]TKB46501.1 hypothetical protein FCL40_17785 [Ferrimonas sediminicola]